MLGEKGGSQRQALAHLQPLQQAHHFGQPPPSTARGQGMGGEECLALRLHPLQQSLCGIQPGPEAGAVGVEGGQGGGDGGLQLGNLWTGGGSATACGPSGGPSSRLAMRWWRCGGA